MGALFVLDAPQGISFAEGQNPQVVITTESEPCGTRRTSTPADAIYLAAEYSTRRGPATTAAEPSPNRQKHRAEFLIRATQSARFRENARRSRGNPFTFPEVKTLLEGVTVGGRRLSDQEKTLNLAEGSRYLIDLVKRREFKLEKSTFCSLHERLTRVRGLHTPFAKEPGAVRPQEVFASGIHALERDVPNPFERATGGNGDDGVFAGLSPGDRADPSAQSRAFRC
jgi:hypothetical protein